MKKRSFITLLAVIFCVTLAAGIAACRSGGSGGSGNTHIHSYSDKWSCDAEYHWHDPVCYHSADEEVPVADKAPHEYEDGVCKVCKYIDDLLIVPQSRKLIEDKIAPVLFADRDEKTILSQNWQLITDNKNEYLTGLAATYIYATEEHTHVVNIDTISFTKFSLENLVGAKFSEFDKDSIKTENKKSLTASLIKTWEVNADEQRKAEALKNLSVADGYENTVRTLFADADGYNFLLECNAGTTRINSSAYADTKIEGRQVTELEYTVREHKYTTDNLCAATDCGYDGLEYEEIEGGYAITGTGELDKSKLKILNLSPTHKDRTVKKIGNDAFSGCTNLETVRIIGNNNAYIEEIGSRAFEGCERLYDFAWRKSLTSIGYDAFKGCVSLYRVQLEGTPQIGSGAFSGCKKIIEVYCMYNDLTEGSSSYGGIASYAKHVYGPNIEGHESDSSQVWKSVNGDSEPFAGATFIFYNDTKDKKDYLIGLDGGSFNFTTTDKLILPKKLAHLGYSTEKYEVYDYAFAHFDEIKSVEIPESATAVASTAFDGCDNLESIETAEENTAYASQDGILYNKNKTQIIFVPKAIKSVTLPDGITDIGNAFANCANLESITVTDNNTAYSSQDGILYNKDKTQIIFVPEAIKSVTLPDGITDIGNAFANCANLESITVTDNNTAYSSQDGILYNKEKTEFIHIPQAIKGSVTIPDSVTSIGDRAFEKRTGLTSTTIGNGVTSIGGDAFSCCESLTSITIPDSVTSIGDYAFYDCSLESITIPDSVTSIGQYAFSGCTSLISITIPDSVTSIGEDAFFGTAYYNNQDNWTNDVLYIDNYLIDAKSTLSENYEIEKGTKLIADRAFYGCTSLESITVSDNNTEYASQDGILYNKDKTKFIHIPQAIKGSITIPDSVTSIGSSAFRGCTSLESVTIGNGVTSIGQEAFSGCTNLESITIPDSVTSIGSSAFRGCTSLESVTIGNGVTSIGQEAFSVCTSLTSVTIGNGVTSIGEEAFEDCYNLKGVYITDIAAWCNIDFKDNVYYYYRTPLYYAHNLYLNNNLVTELTAEMLQGVTTIKDSAFAGCTSLISITIPDSVTSIGYEAFYRCTNLESINFDDKSQLASIGDEAFVGCTSLTSITIPDSVTSIGNSVFQGCTSLTSITIPDSVTSIGYNTFVYCTSLESVKFKNPTGWYCTKDSSATSGMVVDIPKSSLQNPNTAARYLKDTYSKYYWKRKS